MSSLALVIVGWMVWLAPGAPPDSSHATIERAAAAALTAQWPDVAARATVRVVRLSGGAERVQSPVRVHFLSEAPPHGRASARVEQATSDGWVPAGWAWLDVAHTATAAVLVRALARGETVTAADYRLEPIETTRQADPPVPPDSLYLGAWTASRPLAAGTVLTHRLLALPLAAEAGSAVRVRHQRGAVLIAFETVARERGAVGEAVRVYDPNSRRTHRVRLTAPGEGIWLSTL